MRRGSLIVLLVAFLAVAARADEPTPAPAPAAPGSAPLESAFLPKTELHVPEFLAAHPEFDGRGVLVAVLDTGVDPGHPRLAKTSTGEGKIVDFLDATDDGLVDTSQPVEAVNGQALGTTGRTLTLGDHVVPGKRAYLGRIDAHDVLPARLVERVRATRRARLDEAIRRAKESGAPPSPARPGEDAAAAEARRAAEAEARGSLPDDAPVYDVLVCEKQDGWRVVIDTDADGDLTDERELRDFSVAQEWVRLGDDAELDVGVRPDPDGRRVRILFDGNGHGTHVAGIVAGFEGPGSALNGVAPGARILAIKVGNSRWGGPTTNLAVLRALDWAGRRGARVVNLSFGGPSFLGDAGTPDARAADEAVERYGLLCCFSAGNEGPALSTVGSPATAHRVLAVGAYVSPATMKVSYAQLGPDPGERLFGFSSRGPLPGGDLGVSVVAPGAAWSPLPPWLLVGGDNWNGTSMAAPQVAGAAALLLSGALTEGVPAGPARVIRAVKATARPVPGLLPVEQGAGLVQVDRAYEALRRMRDAPPERELRARVSNPTGVGGGVYDRDLTASAPADRAVQVSVAWAHAATNEDRTAYERRLVLSADRPWIQVPPRLGLNADGGSFAIRLDAAALPEGLHVGLVTATDPARPDDGPELVVPVTVVRAASADAAGRWHASVPVESGERVSRFVRVPFGASRAHLRVAARDGGQNTLSVALASLDQWRAEGDRMAQARARLAAGNEHEATVPVLPGTVLEVVLFSHWNANAPATYDLDLWFEGPVSPDSCLAAGPGEDVVLLRLSSPLAPFTGRAGVVVREVVERPSVSKEVAPDGGDAVFGGDRFFVSRQRFTVRVAAGERVRVVPLGTHGLDEQREDARWRVVDAAGQVVRKAVIDGAFDLGGLPAGAYSVEYETPTWNRAAADAGLTGFEVCHAVPDRWGTVHPTADLAADGRGEDPSLDLPAGSARSVALRLPALDPGRLWSGAVEVRDAKGDLRLSVPILADRRTDAAEPDPSAAEESLVAALRAAASRVAEDPLSTPAVRQEALGRADRARGLRPSDVDLEILALRLRVAPGRERVADDKGAADAPDRLEKALARLDRARAEDRPRVGRVLLLRGVLRQREGRPEAAADLTEARFLLPENDPDLLAVRVERGLAQGGDLRDALAAARAVREGRPTEFEASARMVDVLLRLGWGIPAAMEIRSWPDRFPTRVAEFRAAAARVKVAGVDPGPRTLHDIERGIP